MFGAGCGIFSRGLITLHQANNVLVDAPQIAAMVFGCLGAIVGKVAQFERILLESALVCQFRDTQIDVDLDGVQRAQATRNLVIANDKRVGGGRAHDDPVEPG